MNNDFDNKKKAFISYWTNTILLKLYNMFYVVNYLEEVIPKKGIGTDFKDINEKLEVNDIMNKIKENSKYKKYLESRKKLLKDQGIKIVSDDNIFNDLEEYLINTRDHFSHPQKYYEQNPQKANYNFNEDKFLILIFIYLEQKQLNEFLSMIGEYNINIHDYYYEIKNLIAELDENYSYKKLINNIYGLTLSEKISDYFTILNMKKIPTEIQTYDLLITFLEELYPDDKEIIDELKERNSKANLKRYKGNLNIKKNLVLSKNVLIQLIAYKLVDKIDTSNLTLKEIIDMLYASEHKKENKNITKEDVLKNRVQFIESKMEKISELNFNDLKKNAIKGMNRYVIANGKDSNNNIQRNYNNKRMLNDLYNASDVETFVLKCKELFKSYNLEPLKVFDNKLKFKELLIEINKFLWNDIINKYKNKIIDNSEYLYKLLRISNLQGARTNEGFIGIKPKFVFKILFKDQKIKNKSKLGRMNGKNYLLFWLYTIKSHKEYLEKINFNNFDKLLLISYLYKHEYKIFKNIHKLDQNEFLSLILKEIKKDKKNRMSAMINYITNSNQSYNKKDIEVINDYINLGTSNYEEVIKNINSIQKAKEFFFTMKVLLDVSADTVENTLLIDYRNAVFHNKRKKIYEFEDWKMKKIVGKINDLLNGDEKIGYYQKSDNRKNLLRNMGNY